MAPGRPAAPRRPNVLIVGDFSFPYGTGASSRVFNYARGLQAAGARVKVICVEPGGRGRDTLNVAARGAYRGVPFEYTYGRTTRPSSAGWRRVLRLAGWPRFVLEVRRCAAAADGLDAMLVYSRSLPWIALAWLSCRLLGATLLHEDCELPFVWKAETPRLRVRRWLFQRVAFKAFDGCLVISTYLDAYCRRYLRPGAGTLLVPILVDVADVSPGDLGSGERGTDETGGGETGGAPAPPADGGNVLFAGSLDHPEVDDLLVAFAVVAAAFPEVRLEVLGAAKRAASLSHLRARVDQLGLSGRVEFPGALPREALFERLSAARLLVLPRPAGAFSQAGLPTKVAEYLASGVPTVVTAVGDLPLYLRDGIDAYLVAPGDPAAFGARLCQALADPQAPAVGRRGRRVAAERFDPARHGGRILAFISALREGKPFVDDA
jgi:glycosyltransferase involved in cell wall biosynthesis